MLEKPKAQSKIDNPETPATLGTRNRTHTRHMTNTLPYRG